ncbi:PDZ domain-containing protein [Nocardioides sp. IC4_145]|uniref:trypsin-like peptidase domain-containing protein n=1 Tax=Nocardioides sp. IC4_145 TaxID=2714037 RepID=UPI00140B308A|nr:PDZ domain-containing protein [Nocardioides sp. IC4_145]
MLATSVAVPVTSAVLNDPVAVPGPSTEAQAADDGEAVESPADFGELPGEGRAALPRESFGQAAPDTLGEASVTAEQATAEQAAGIVLVESETAAGAGAGTGVVVGSDGLVVTNYHVVEGAGELRVTVATSGENYAGEVLGFDETADIAVVQLSGAEGLVTAALDDEGPDVDDSVVAVGNASGSGALYAVTGTVTATEKSITTSDGFGMPSAAQRLEGLVQTTAPAVPGYSGGPTLDEEGEVLGLTTAASSTGAGESFAVPIEDVLLVLQAVEAGDEAGSIQVGPSAYLGVTVGPGAGDGVTVGEVVAGSPAADAELDAGDTITSFAGTDITTADALADAVRDLEPGDDVSLSWQDTAGEQHSATVRLGTSPYA